MKTLSYPHINNIELWDKIVSRKRQPAKGKLLLIRDKVFSRYSFFETHFGSLDDVQPLSRKEWDSTRAELISCFGNNAEFKRVRQQLFHDLSATNQTKCPYCMLSRPNTLEHYFDKDGYPEFSVFIPNLVPCCSECNSAKSAFLFDPQGNRKYIHFYHDLIPEDQFLFIRFSFSVPDAIPLVSISLSFSQQNYASELVQRHFSNLSLISKYHRAILDRLAPIIEEIRMNYQSGIPAETITTSLENTFQALAKHYGNNYWETCIYEGILNSPGFLNQLLCA